MSLQKIRTELERLRSEVEGVEEKYEIAIWRIHDDGTLEGEGESAPPGRLTADEVEEYLRERKAAGVNVWSIEIETVDVGTVAEDENDA